MHKAVILLKFHTIMSLLLKCEIKIDLEAILIISDEVKGNSLIGEATINLIFNREEVTLSALLLQLQCMAKNEADQDKLTTIGEVYNGLKTYINAETSQAEQSRWRETVFCENNENNSSPPIHSLVVSKNDD